jgi:hypothetical protein
MDFLDIASRYAQNRFDTATQPFTDPTGYAENRLGIGGETEEERRRRLEREARDRAAAEAVPVTQTVKTNPVTGEQEMTIKGSPQDLSAANPLTPTVTGPVAPAQAQPMVQPMEQPTLPPVLSTPPPTVTQPQPPIPQLHPDHQAAIDRVLPPANGGTAQAMPAAQPAPMARPPAVTFSDIPGQEVNNGYPTMPRLQGQAPAPAPVAPQAMPAPAAMPAPGPVNPTAPAMPAPSVRPAPVEQAGPPTSLMSPGGWEDRITTAKTGQDYRQIMADPNTPEPIAQLAAGRYAESLTKDKEEKKAEQVVMAAAQGDPKATNDLTRALRKNTEEGSYIKAVLFARLGLNDLAKEEQQKLGGGQRFESMVGPDGQRYTADVSGQGGIMRAYDATGQQVDERKVAELNANAISAKGIGHAGATRIRDSQGKEWSVVPTTRGSIFYDTSGRPGVPTGATVPITTGSDIGLEYNKRFYGAQGSAQGKGAGEGFTPGTTIPAPGMPGGTLTAEGWARQNGIPVSAKGGTRTNEEQWNQYDAWVAGGRQGPAVARPGTSRHEAGQAIDVPAEGRTPENRKKLEDAGFVAPIKSEPWHYELPKNITTPTTSSGAVIPSTSGTSAPGTGNGLAQQRQQLEVQGKRSESFNKIIDTEFRENGQKGEIVSNNRKTQFDILNRVDPATGKGMAETISGLYTAANESPNNQKLTIIRDILTGKILPEQDASKRIAELNISPAAKGALQEYVSLNAQIAAQTLRETAGPGSVSDAEQAANKARNVDITRAPMLGAYNIMGQSQFNGDLSRYKSDLAADSKLSSATAFDRQFRGTQAELVRAYREVSEARLDYINKNGGANNPAAIRQGYKKYPTPEYDPTTGQWKYLKPLDKIFK